MNRLLTSFLILVTGLAAGYIGQPFLQQQFQLAGLLDEQTTGDNTSTEAEILYWVAPMDANYRRDKPGKSPMGMDLVPVYKEQQAEPEILYWVAPMDANYRRDKPGKSPMGMDLVPVYAEQGAEEGVVKISPAVENNLGVRIDQVKRAVLDKQINTVGYITFDEEKLFHIHSRVEGWVEKLNVQASGDVVSKGQKLFELYSPTLVNAQEEYLTALKSNNSRLSKASRDRLIALGVSNKHIKQLDKTRLIDQRINYYSKNKGFIKKLNIREGMFIKPSMDVLTIGQLDTVWVIAEIFERQSGWVKTGQKVDMKVAAYPNKSWQGIVDYIYPVLDEKTRTLRVRIRFDNSDGQLKPNMFARLVIHSQSDNETLLIKREAVIRNGQNERVVKSLGDGKYLSVLVKTGNENSQFIEILQGLNEQDNIVTSAHFLIDSESSLTASFKRMEEPPAMDMPMQKMNTEMMMDHSNMDGMSSMSTPTQTAPLNENQAWVRGTVMEINKNAATMSIQHKPLDKWGWPQMTMDFPVSESVNINIFDQQEDYNFLIEKEQSGSIKIIDFNKKVQP